MQPDTSRDGIQPIRGDILLDRLFGWLSFVCALPVFGLSFAKLTGRVTSSVPDPAWLEPVRITMTVLALVAFVLVTRSSRPLFKVCIGLFVIRTIGLLAAWPWSGGPRFAGSELLFDLVAIWYCWLRWKALPE